MYGNCLLPETMVEAGNYYQNMNSEEPFSIGHQCCVNREL